MVHEFKTAHVLNLPQKPENFERVCAAFASFGFECAREIGVVGENPHASCTKGHLNFVRRAKDSGKPFAMLFEDDCMPCAGMSFWAEISDYLARHSEEWDMFYGGATMVHPVRWVCGFRHPSLVLVECSHALSVHFIIYNRSCYERALGWFDLKVPEEGRPPIDTWLASLGLRIWTTNPAVAVQRPSFSNSLGKMVDYSDYFERAGQKLEAFVKMRSSSLLYRFCGRFLAKI
jgi:hypothetical protein